MKIMRVVIKVTTSTPKAEKPETYARFSFSITSSLYFRVKQNIIFFCHIEWKWWWNLLKSSIKANDFHEDKSLFFFKWEGISSAPIILAVLFTGPSRNGRSAQPWEWCLHKIGSQKTVRLVMSVRYLTYS